MINPCPECGHDLHKNHMTNFACNVKGCNCTYDQLKGGHNL